MLHGRYSCKSLQNANMTALDALKHEGSPWFVRLSRRFGSIKMLCETEILNLLNDC